MPQTTVKPSDIKLTDINRIRLAATQGPLAESNRTATNEATTNFRVALVNMPFASGLRPSIQVGLLKAIGRRAGFPVDDLYLNVDLAAQLGFGCYEELAVVEGHNTGEWLFSVAAFGEDCNRADYFGAFPSEAKRIAEFTGLDVERLNRLRERVIPDYVDACLNKIDWQAYNAVEFTSTFQQNVASLALARRIKEKYPHIPIIFGGANMEGGMGLEYVRAFPCIDYAVVGEGDVVFPALLTYLAEGRRPDDLLGVATRCGASISFIGPATPVRDLNSLPTPDYDTYYAEARRHGLSSESDTSNAEQRRIVLHEIPVEGSRGCWWGEKQHCTFCGLNGLGMAYRSKAPERMLSELDELSQKYGMKGFWATDNILDMKFINGLFALLGERQEEYTFFWEVKANMTREQVRLLRKGGMRVMQPGIESLSTAVLKLMRKGITKLQNVNLLRWCRYYDISPAWNLLYGFVGERWEDCADELATCRLITHVRPPMACQSLRLERFSPHFWDKELFPTQWQHAEASYRYVYPEHVNLDEAGYFFDYGITDILPDEAHQETKDFVSKWHAQWFSEQRASLTYRRTGADMVIEDTRFGPEKRKTYTLAGLDAQVYEAFSSAPRTPAQVGAALASDCPGLMPDVEAIADACETLCDAGLMIGEAGKYLSLAIPADYVE